MKALRFEKTGSFDELALHNVAKPLLGPGEALVRVKAAGINGVSQHLTRPSHRAPASLQSNPIAHYSFYIPP